MVDKYGLPANDPFLAFSSEQPFLLFRDAVLFDKIKQQLLDEEKVTFHPYQSFFLYPREKKHLNSENKRMFFLYMQSTLLKKRYITLMPDLIKLLKNTKNMTTFNEKEFFKALYNLEKFNTLTVDFWSELNEEAGQSWFTMIQYPHYRWPYERGYYKDLENTPLQDKKKYYNQQLHYYDWTKTDLEFLEDILNHRFFLV